MGFISNFARTNQGNVSQLLSNLHAVYNYLMILDLNRMQWIRILPSLSDYLRPPINIPVVMDSINQNWLSRALNEQPDCDDWKLNIVSWRLIFHFYFIWSINNDCGANRSVCMCMHFDCVFFFPDEIKILKINSSEVNHSTYLARVSQNNCMPFGFNFFVLLL